MRYYTPALIALTTAGVLLAAGGCGTTGTFAAAHRGPAVPGAAAAASAIST
jgi:hypothetical protein